MPGREYYHGLSLADRVRKCAEHHYDVRTRHLARYEYEMLLDAAEELGRYRLGSAEPETAQGSLALDESA